MKTTPPQQSPPPATNQSSSSILDSIWNTAMSWFSKKEDTSNKQTSRASSNTNTNQPSHPQQDQRVAREAPKPSVPKFSMDSLVKLQEAEGNWNLDENFCQLIGIEESTIRKLSVVADKKFWATCIALKILEKFFRERKEEWELLANKAKKWTENANKQKLNLVDVFEAANKLVEQLNFK